MYPNSDLSAGQLTIMAVVVVAVLAAWLIAVFLAARQPRGKSAAVSAGRRDEETAATVTQLPSDDRPSGKAAALSGITPRRGAPAPGMTACRASRPGSIRGDHYPVIFAKAISGSDAYAGQIRDLRLRRVPADQALRELTTSDVSGVRRAAPGV